MNNYILIKDYSEELKIFAKFLLENEIQELKEFSKLVSSLLSI